MDRDGGFDHFDDILCIGLKDRAERRRHIAAEFERVGIQEFTWIDAFDKDSQEVRRVFDSEFVQKYPPCFRCGRDACECGNKKLFPAQIGNWLSHQVAWRSVRGAGLTLICEDDVKFTDRVHEALRVIFGSHAVNADLASRRAVLVRLGWALNEEHGSQEAFKLSRDIRMANPCYAINEIMGRLLLTALQKISTTSDIYLHRVMGSQVAHHTVHPPVAYDLSWSTGELRSEIRPKHNYIDRLQARLDTLEPGRPEYLKILASIESERRRMEEYESFNDASTGYDKDRFPSL